MVDVTAGDESDIEGLRAKRMPYGFWACFIREDMGLQYSHRKKTQLCRPLKPSADRKKAGTKTRVA